MNNGQPEAQSVTVLLPFPVFGAAEDYCVVLACGLLRRGWSVKMVVPEAIDGEPAITSAAYLGAGVVPIAGAVLNSPLRLRTVLKGPGCASIFHVNHFFLPGIAAAISTRCAPTIVTVHTPALHVRYSLKGRALAHWVTPRVSKWIALSQRNKSLVAGQMSVREELISVVSPGLPVERFVEAGPANRQKARSRLGLADEEFVVGTVGRLSRQKRHDILIQAAGLALSEISNLRVVIVGDGELRPQIEASANAGLPNRVLLPGYREDVTQLLPAFDVFCLTSDFEGLPFALLEAMATGLPIIATDVQGSGEAVSDGVEGILVPPGSPPEVAGAMVRLAKDSSLAATLGNGARRRFFKEFRADVMVGRTIDAYGQLGGRWRSFA